jgi:hypothetical protein
LVSSQIETDKHVSCIQKKKKESESSI